MRLVVILLGVTTLLQGGDAVSELCLTCLCEASSQCDLKLRCENDACGPFQITYLYWVDGGKRGTGWETCSMDLQCATDTVRGYMHKYQKDCDGDGQTDCGDYARIHKLGGVGCINEPDEGFDDFKSDLDACLAEVNASMPGIP
ncbi:lysozyme isoform X3 [Cryptotermes secundus]|uniref:lysozyme isoform X3 n=1 Tax=Cryptotermes secundus TaxID=105785 RepID=UPI000CD7BFD0|nr:lysozyme isoform X3 [Cryptotermes secundus]